jgi:hypothetical protein
LLSKLWLHHTHVSRRWPPQESHPDRPPSIATSDLSLATSLVPKAVRTYKALGRNRSCDLVKCRSKMADVQPQLADLIRKEEACYRKR